MLDKKLDRRIVRTRNLLKEALLNLIQEKGYEAITIENITDRANLGRATFYLHYHDKAELLLESIDSIAEDLINQATQSGYIPGLLPDPANPVTPKKQAQSFLMVFKHASQKAELWRIILRGEGMTMASVRIREILGKIAGNYFEDQMKAFTNTDQHLIPSEVVANYFAVSLMGFLTWWLESDMKYPAEQMAEMFRAMFFQGVQRAAGLPLLSDD